MRVTADNFEAMRRWLALLWPLSDPRARRPVPSEADPLVQLDRIAVASPAKARRGLEMAIGDLIEMTVRWPAGQVAAADERLRSEGLPTLTEMRATFSRAVGRVLCRGRIGSEAEYHAVRDAAEMDGAHQARLWALIAAYEEECGRQS